MLDPHLALVVAAWANARGWGALASVTRCTAGGNNQVWHVTTVSKRASLLKVYFRHPGDTRDRLGAEWALARYAWDAGLRALAEPLAVWPEHGAALFDWIEGRPILADQLAPRHLTAALSFLEALQRGRLQAAARALPPASEACFRLTDHWACLERRLNALGALPPADEITAAARDFVNQRLCPAAEPSRLALLEQDENELLPEASRILSPSDFGFHNALDTPAGTSFFDFEYAGWDDPAKLSADFCSQVAVPVPSDWWAPFTRAVCSLAPSRERALARAQLLLPLYRIKWCCIMLNEFLPVGAARRRQARPAEDETARRRMQLARAQAGLAELSALRELTL